MRADWTVRQSANGTLPQSPWPDAASLGIISAFILVLFLPPLFHNGPLLQTDQPLWAAVAHIWGTDVVPSQGWIPGTITDRVAAGIVAGTVYSASHSLLYLLSLGLDPETTVKVAMLISAGLLLFSFYGVARLHLPPSYSVLATVLLFAPYFDNFVSGMWYNYLGLGFGFAFWLCSDHYERRLGRWSLVLAGACFALAIYSHPVGAVLCVCVWIAFLLKLSIRSSKHGLRASIAYGGLVPVAAMLAAPQLHALLTSSTATGAGLAPAPLGLTPFFELARRLFVIRVWGAMEQGSTGTALLPFYILSVSVLFGVGALVAIRNRKGGPLPVLAALLAVSFLLISRAYNLLPAGAFDGIRSALDVQYSRFQVLSQIYIVILSVHGISSVFDYLRKRFVRRTAIVVQGIVMVPILAIATQPLFKIYVYDTGQLSTLSQSLLAEDLEAFWTWTRETVDAKSTRICLSDTYGELNFYDSRNPEAFNTHVFALTTVYSDINQIGGWTDMGRFSVAHASGGPLWSLRSSDAEMRDEIRMLNCQYVVAVNGRLRTKMKESPSLQTVMEFKGFSVFKSTFLRPSWAWNMRTGADVRVSFHAADDIEIGVDGMQGDAIFVSRAYFPQWRAEQDGSQVSITNYREFVVVELPRSGPQTVRLRFVSDRELPRDMVLAGVLLSALLALAVPKSRMMPSRL